MTTSRLTESLRKHLSLLEQIEPEILSFVEALADKLTRTLLGQNTLLVAGNGGSAADAQHLAAEFVGRYQFDRPALPAIALTTDTSAITAIANDYDFASIFSRQIEALGRKGDLLLLISTSGRSPNIVQAARVARERGLYTAALLGNNGGDVLSMVDTALVVPCEDTARIQEIHLLVEHLLCEAAESMIFRGGS